MRTPTLWDVLREARLWPRLPGLASIGLIALAIALRVAGGRTVGIALIAGGILAALLAYAARPTVKAENRARLETVIRCGILAVPAAAGLWIADGPSLHRWLIYAGVGGWAVTTAWWVWDRLLRPLNPAQWVTRRKEHSNHNQGTASVWDVMQHASRWAMRRRARVLRPSLAGLTRRELRRVPATAFAVLVARVGWALGRVGVYSSCEDVTARIGGPRYGKTMSLAPHVADAPGAVVCTSTKADLYQETVVKRRLVGAVHVFNPTGYGDVRSTIRWSPLIGCEDFPVASRRAEAMISLRSGGDAVWDEQARRILAVLLYAAARTPGARLQLVAEWVAKQTETTNEAIIGALNGAPNRAFLVAAVKQFTDLNDRTRTSVTNSIAPALSWLADEGAAEVGDAPRESITFDACEFLSGRNTLYLIGQSESAVVAPLLSALTAELAHAARMEAGRRPGGRLDPAASLVLDEMVQSCGQVPIDSWTSDFGGRGIMIHLTTQSLAQMRQQWGAEKTAATLNNVSTLMIFGGTKAADDLAAYVALVGERLETLDEDDRRYTETLSAQAIASLAPGEVLVLARGLRPIVGRAPMIWDRPSWWSRLRSLVRPAVTPAPAPAPAPVPLGGEAIA